MAQLIAEPSSTSSTHDSRCRHYTVHGRQCRLPVFDNRSGLCFRDHGLSAVQPSSSDSEDLSAELLPQLSEFTSAADINQFLARLLALVTKGRVSPRRASVLAYITNQLLHSHRAIDRETIIIEDPPIVLPGDIPRPLR